MTSSGKVCFNTHTQERTLHMHSFCCADLKVLVGLYLLGKVGQQCRTHIHVEGGKSIPLRLYMYACTNHKG